MATGVDKGAPPKRGASWLVLGVVAAVAVAAGAALPMFLGGGDHRPKKNSPEKEAKKPAVLPFGDAVVNLNEDRLTRYLRVKILLVVDGHEEKALNEHIQKQKAALKSWLIGY